LNIHLNAQIVMFALDLFLINAHPHVRTSKMTESELCEVSDADSDVGSSNSLSHLKSAHVCGLAIDTMRLDQDSASARCQVQGVCEELNFEL